MSRFYENLGLWKPESIECAGKYEIPRILPEEIPPVEGWKPVNYCLSGVPSGVGLHCFVDDYQIQRLWNSPTKYIEPLRRAKCVCSPDFSMFTDTPKALNLYNHYRKHWIGAYW